MKYDIAVVIGRFQPFHNGHLNTIKQAFEVANTVHIVVGSANQPPTIKNPFSAGIRIGLIKEATMDLVVGGRMLRVSSVEDNLYHDAAWIKAVQEAVDAGDKKVAVLGYEKDESSFYLKIFPTWDYVAIPAYMEDGGHPIDASKIRELLFENHLHYAKTAVPASVYRCLQNYQETEEYQQLVGEYQYIRSYRKQWEVAPYPVTFFTVDSVVVQGGNLLLVQRKAAPGEGLWALPGGFINPNEKALDSAIRELREETRIKVPEAVLRGSVRAEKLFDHPQRSLRGRTITQAFLFELPDQPTLPKVKGSDDAAAAKWFSLNEVARMTNVLFEDHASIIKMMINRTK